MWTERKERLEMEANAEKGKLNEQESEYSPQRHTGNNKSKTKEENSNKRNIPPPPPRKVESKKSK